jgi:hypothetical protein
VRRIGRISGRWMMFKENELGNRYCPFIQGMCNLKCVFIKKILKGDITSFEAFDREYECIIENYFRKNFKDD